MATLIEGTCAEGEHLLIRHALATLRKMAGRRDYTRAIWKFQREVPQDPKGVVKTWRITRRNGSIIYYQWSALGSYPPPGMSLSMPIGEFIRMFEVVAQQQETE